MMQAADWVCMQRLIRTNADFMTAVKAWLRDPVTGEANYGHISLWDVSQVTEMDYAFCEATDFNQNINDWNVSNVTNMRSMFLGAYKFNQPLSKWNVSKVTKMGGMFSAAKEFNQDLTEWNVAAVTDREFMFHQADSFDLDREPAFRFGSQFLA